MPTLLLYAGDDRLVNPEGSRRFAAAAPASIVESHGFDALWHEIFNEREPERTQVLDVLAAWLVRRVLRRGK